MNNDKTRNDFIFFQNEILGDVKKVETKVTEKLSQTISFLETQTEKYENKIKDLTNKFNLLTEQVHEQNNTHKLEESLQVLQVKMEDLISKVEIKLNILNKDFNNACYKYDKIFTTNLNVPGLIGTSCPYSSLRAFLEYVNQKFNELLKAKDKQTMDSKKYKEKMENLITQNKIQFETAQQKIDDYCHQSFEQCDIACKDRINLIEKRIESLRLENGQYAYDLKQKTEELQIEWDKLNKIENILNKKFKEEWNKYNDIVDKISNKFDKNNNEFHLIKNRFTELSEFIKDVRFRRNLGEMNQNNYNKERKQYREMSYKIDFSKKHKTKKMEKLDLKSDKNENETIESYDNNNNNNDHNDHNNDHNNEYNEEENKRDNLDNLDNNNFNSDIINELTNNENEKNKKVEEVKFKKIENSNGNKVIDDNNNNINKKNYNLSDIHLSSQNKKNTNEIMNNSSEFQSASSNVMSNNIFEFMIDKDNKNANKKNKKKDKNNNDSNTYNIINYNNDSNTYNIINYSRFNDNKMNHYNEIHSDTCNQKSNIKEKDQIKNNLIMLAENAKINNLVLGADFSGNNLYNVNTPTLNLSQAYLLIKKRNEEIQKMKKTNKGKSEPKYNQLSPPSSLNLSRNIKSNGNLNKINYYTKRDFKKKNKEDLFYSTLKNDKLRKIGPNQNIIINISNQENFNNYKKNYPKIIKDKNQNTNNLVEFNTININENNLDIKSLTQKGRNFIKIPRKLVTSSSSELLVKLSPFSPVYKERLLIHKNKENEKKQMNYNGKVKAKETLNHINPYLVQKFKDV